MRCPVCSNELVTVDALQSCAIDICQHGCNGIWCDAGELDQIDEEVELAAPSRLRMNRNADVVIDREATRTCPRCSYALDRISYDSSHRVEVDQCGKCSGVWLDIGELETIHDDNKQNELMSKVIHDTEARSKADTSGRLQAFVRVIFHNLWK